MLGGEVVVEGVVLVHEAFLAVAVASGYKRIRKVGIRRWTERVRAEPQKLRFVVIDSVPWPRPRTRSWGLDHQSYCDCLDTPRALLAHRSLSIL